MNLCVYIIDSCLKSYKIIKKNILFGYLVPPCLNTALWKQSSNTCNYLKNGTNNIWYTVGLRYHSSLRWCDAFRNCYGSNDLRNLCRRDFDFYFRFPPTFTVEILSYLPHTRIQVNYVCSGRYIFAFNVIRCNSESKLNGMFGINVSI